ncbi:Lrp/AsnC ligand binding domain-containing protein [Bradyrhizobium sp. USDA 4451]
MCAVAQLDGWLDDFRRAVAQIPKILEASRLIGGTDSLLRLVVPALEVYDAVYKKLIASLDFADVSSFTSMKS